jgi:hypothetical protein
MVTGLTNKPEHNLSWGTVELFDRTRMRYKLHTGQVGARRSLHGGSR